MTRKLLQNTDNTNTTNNASSPSPKPGVFINALGNASAGALPPVPSNSCSPAKSPSTTVSAASGTLRFTATLSGLKNVRPNDTGVLAPVGGPSRDTYTLLLDQAGRKASWTLELCDVPAYTASHLHTGSAKADYPPPLVPLEPYQKPADPLAPPNLLPQLCPPLNITGCSYTATGSFVATDISPLLGREPQGDREVPTVATWNQLLAALRAGKIYINVHSKLAPAGLIRGNLEAASRGGGSGGGGGGGSGGGGSQAGGGKSGGR